jgi:hypothetical protein
MKGSCLASLQRHAQPGKNIQAVGHQAFATCFIDWRLCTISDYHSQPMLTGGDSRSKASRAAANYKYVCI